MRLFFLLKLFLLFSYLNSSGQDMNSNKVSPELTTVKVYPNPAGHNFYVDIYSGAPANAYKVSVVNILGQVIYRSTAVADTKGSTHHQVLLSSDTPKGLYFISIQGQMEDQYVMRLQIE